MHMLMGLHLATDPHLSVGTCLSQAIVRRDLKPSNILLTLEGLGNVVVRLADFGSAANSSGSGPRQMCGGILGPSRDALADNMFEPPPWICTVE